METLTLEKENVIAAFEAGDESQKALLKKLWPTVFKPDPYLLACKKLGITPEPPLADRSNRRKVASEACDRLMVCIEAKNMIDGKPWKPVYDGNEQHWFPDWKIVKDPKRPSGVGLAFHYAYYWRTSTNVGSRLEYRSEKLLLEGVEEFYDLYVDFLTW